MFYHLIVATAGLAVLLGGWLLVQRLAAGSAALPDAQAGCALPNPDATAPTACGGCAACRPVAAGPREGSLTDDLPRDGPANAPSPVPPPAREAPGSPTRVMP